MAVPLSFTGRAAGAAVITVTTAADRADAGFDCAGLTPDLLPGPDGVVSLREAICAANAHPGPDTITFALPADSVITLAAPLPALSDDGTNLAGDTAPGFYPNTVAAPGRPTLRPGVQVDASGLAPDTPVLSVTSGGHRLAGLALTGPGPGISFSGPRATRSRVEAMWLGAALSPTVSSTVGSGLSGPGVSVEGGAALLIGGLSPTEANRMSGARSGVAERQARRIKVVANAMDHLSGPGLEVADAPAGEGLAAPRLDPDSASTLTLVGDGVPPGALLDVYQAGPPGAPPYGRRHLGAVTEGGQADADHVADGRFTIPLSGMEVAAGDRLVVTATDVRGTTSLFSSPVVAHGVDADHDGLPDQEELARGLDPFSSDTDSDGVPDQVEACRCSTLLVGDDPPALLELSSVTGLVLRRLALPEGTGPVTGLAAGRGLQGPVVGLVTTKGVVVADLQAEAVDGRVVATRVTDTAPGTPATSADGTRLYVTYPSGRLAVVSLLARRLVASLSVGGSPAALATGEGATLAASFSGSEPGVGVYSLSDPERPTLLYRASSLDGSALVSDTALSAPVSLGATRFAVALGGQGHGPALALFSSTSPGVDVMAVAAPATATIPVALTAGPQAGQVTVAWRSDDGLAGGGRTVMSSGAPAGTTL